MASTENLSDLIKSCINGKRDAQKELYDMFSRKMFGVCIYYTRDTTEAEDVLSEAFMKVFRNLRQYKGKGSFEGWIRRIMVNTALEKYRASHRMHAVSDVFEYANELQTDDVSAGIEMDELMLMVQELSPQYKMVFNLYAIEGYNHKEISDMLGISEGTSKSNLARARVILQRKVKERFSPPANSIRY